MSNSKHTPGPWKTTYFRDSGGRTISHGVLSGDKTRVAASIKREANARLIAAAPELDAYRQYIEDNLERIERGGWTPVCFDEFRESEECANYMTEEEA